jgi:hypothetical protein
LDGDQSNDPQDEIVLLEERIEELATKLESCRKFIPASRIAARRDAVSVQSCSILHSAF